MKWAEAAGQFPWIQTMCERGYGDSGPVYLPRADKSTFQRLNNELAQVDFDRLDNHRMALKNSLQRRLSMDMLKPFRFKRLMQIQTLNTGLAARGKKMLETGMVAEAILAGGAATRFFKGQNTMPKALFPISPVAGKTFLDIFLQEAAQVADKYGIAPPVVIMVSRVTEQQIRHALEEHQKFGLPDECIFILPQAHHPRLDARARIVIQPDGSLVWYGDGHGGVFSALINTGLRVRLMATGVRTLVLHNVDNTLAKPFDVTRLGYHGHGMRLFTMTVYQRKSPEQMVGVLAKLTGSGAVEVIEYSEADPNMMAAKDKDGLLFDCGHVNTNCFNLSAITDKVPPALYTDKPIVVGDKEVRSSTFEVLNQHLTKLLKGLRVGAFAMPEFRCFLPTKTLHGNDSVETTRDFMSTHALDLLRQAGVIFHGRKQTGDLSPILDKAGIKAMFPDKGLELFDHANIYLSPVSGPKIPPFARGVIVRKKGTFILDSLQPFGEFTSGPNRKTSLSLPSPMIYAGSTIEVKKGATLIIRLYAGSVLKIPGKLVVPEGKTMKIELKQGETRTIGG